MTMISLDNGRNYLNAAEAIGEINARNLWDAVVALMDDDIRESVHDALAPCSNEEFLAEYLRRADNDIVIG